MKLPKWQSHSSLLQPWQSKVGPRGPRYHNFSQSAVTGLEEWIPKGLEHQKVAEPPQWASQSLRLSFVENPLEQERSSRTGTLKSGGAHEGRAYLGLHSISAPASFEIGSSSNVLGCRVEESASNSPAERLASSCNHFFGLPIPTFLTRRSLRDLAMFRIDEQTSQAEWPEDTAFL